MSHRPSFDLSGRVCRWIDGDPRTDAVQCRNAPAPGRSFCPEHHARAYKPGSALNNGDADPWAKVPAAFAPEVEAA